MFCTHKLFVRITRGKKVNGRKIHKQDWVIFGANKKRASLRAKTGPGTLIDPLLLIGSPLSVPSTRNPAAISQILSFSN